MDYVQMTLNEWVGMKEQLKKDLIGVQESFVRIGFTLRKIEEQRLYEKDGYASITDFAKAEYGLGASTVSRFISINKKYSIEGYSDRLRPEYANLGSSKLSEMLSLPDGDMEMIQPEATRENIRELKQFTREEPVEGVADDLRELIEKFFESNKEILNELCSSEAYETGETKKMIEIVNTSGNKTFRKGMYFLMMYEQEIKIKKFGSSPESLDWTEFFAITKELFEPAAGAHTWQRYFGKEDEEENDAPKEQVTEEQTAEDTKGNITVLDKEEAVKEEKNSTEQTRIEHKEETEKKEGIAPAQKQPENQEILEKNEHQSIEESDEKRVHGEVQEANKEAREASKEMTEEISEEIPEAHIELSGGYGSRKQYLDGLTCTAAAWYIAKSIKTMPHMKISEVELWEEWLSNEVDENGREIEIAE